MATLSDDLIEILEKQLPAYLSNREQLRLARTNRQLYQIFRRGFAWTRLKLAFKGWRPPPLDSKLGQLSMFIASIDTRHLTALDLDLSAVGPGTHHMLTLPAGFPVLTKVKELKLTLGNVVHQANMNLMFQKIPNVESFSISFGTEWYGYYGTSDCDWLVFPWPGLKDLSITWIKRLFMDGRRRILPELVSAGPHLRKIYFDAQLGSKDEWDAVFRLSAGTLELLEYEFLNLEILELAQVCTKLTEITISLDVVAAACGEMFENLAKFENLRLVSISAAVDMQKVVSQPMNAGPKIPLAEFDRKPEKICSSVTELRYYGLGWDILPLLLPFFPKIEVLSWNFPDFIYFPHQLTGEQRRDCLINGLTALGKAALENLDTLQLSNLMLPLPYFEKLPFPAIKHLSLVNMHDNANQSLPVAKIRAAIAKLQDHTHTLDGAMVTIDNQDYTSRGRRWSSPHREGYFDRYFVPKRRRMSDFVKLG